VNWRRILGAVFSAAVVIFAGLKLAEQWTAVRDALVHAVPNWPLLTLSCIYVLGAYAVLINTWMVVLRGWGHPIRFWDAARIWTISNLGKYIPGKVWALSAMAVMSEAKGVSPVVAAGAAVLITLINTVVGFVVVAATGVGVIELSPIARGAILGLGLAIVCVPPFLPQAAAFAGRLVGREIVLPRLPTVVIFAAAAMTAVAWGIYGLAFKLFVAGVLGQAPGANALYVAIFAGSYLIGFVALFAPGGIGVREVVMADGLRRAGFAVGPAYLVVVASRLWLTVLEIVPALLFIGHGWITARRAPK
jgi:hypothetical protein